MSYVRILRVTGAILSVTSHIIALINVGLITGYHDVAPLQ